MRNSTLVNELNQKAREWDAQCEVWVEQGQAADPILRKNLHKEAAVEIGKLNDDLEMTRSIMNAWFDISKKLETDIEPILMEGIRGYLKTSVNGGMDHKLADAVESVLADYIRLYAGKALVPIVRGIAANSQLS